MSLTLIQAPQQIQLSNNYVPLVYSSTSATTTGFKYKVDLYNSSGSIFNSCYLWPDITNSNYMIYNMSYLYKDLISYRNYWNTSAPQYCDKGLYSYKWKVTEYVGLVSGATTNITSTYNLLRGVKQYDETFNYTEYLPRTALPTAKFLTKQSRSRKYKLTDWATVNTLWGTFSGTTASFTKIYIIVHPAESSTLYYMNHGGEIPEGLYTLPIGPKNINAACAAGKVYTGAGALMTQPIIDSSIIYYEILLYNGSDPAS